MLSSSLPKDIIYTTHSTVKCMTHAPFVIMCTLPYIWTIEIKIKLYLSVFLHLIHRLSDQSICINSNVKVNINKFKSTSIFCCIQTEKNQTNILHHINFMHDEYLCRGKREQFVEIIDTRMFVYNATWPQSTYFFIVTSQTVFLRCLVYKIKSDHALFIEPMFVM